MSSDFHDIIIQQNNDQSDIINFNDKTHIQNELCVKNNNNSLNIIEIINKEIIEPVKDFYEEKYPNEQLITHFHVLKNLIYNDNIPDNSYKIKHNAETNIIEPIYKLFDKSTFPNNYNFGSTATFNIPTSGDFIQNNYLTVSLPEIKLNKNNQSVNDTKYFDNFIPYSNAHSNTQSNVIDNDLYKYSFALHPETYQPSGSVNFSRIEPRPFVQFLGSRINTQSKKYKLKHKHKSNNKIGKCSVKPANYYTNAYSYCNKNYNFG